MEGKYYKAVVVGATGLVGRCLVQLLIKDINCTEVRIIVRREAGYNHPKVKQVIIDFDNKEDYKAHIRGDVLFSCLGTTRAQAKTKEKQYLVDYTYQYTAAECASKNGIEHYILVSSPYADINSGNYYRKMKAELERDTIVLPFKKITFIRPNGLVGKRENPRKAEMYAIKAFTWLSRFVKAWKAYKPIEAKYVAESMVKSFYSGLKIPERVIILTRNEVMDSIK